MGDTLLAGFTTTTACQFDPIVFTDTSIGTDGLTTFNWNFADGTPISASSQGPHSVVFNTPGSRNIELIIDNGVCDDTATVSVNVLTAPIPSATPDTSICSGDTIQLSANNGVSYAWSDIAFIDDTTSQTPLVSPASDTSYIVFATDASGCAGRDTVEITVNSAPTIAIINDTSVCLGDTIQLTASGGTTYTWTPTSNISDPAIDNPLVFPTVNTTYQVVVQNAASCVDSATVDVSVIALPTVGITNDTSICIGDSIQLSASGGTNYSWSPNSTIDNIALQNPTVFPNVATTYSVEVTDANNCTAQDSVEITLNALPVITLTNDTTICLGDTVQLEASGGTTFLWSPTDSLSDPNISNPLADPSDTTTYTVEVTDGNGCTDSETVTVNIALPPTVILNGDQTICENDTALLVASGGTSYSWSPLATLFTPTDDSTLANPTVTTTYTVEVTDALGCAKDTTVDVIVNPLPVVNASNDTTLCLGDTAQLTATGALNYTWTPTDSLSSAGIASPLADPSLTTTYTVVGEDGSGCRDTADVTVTVAPLPTISTSGDQTICENDTAQISASGGTSYVWTPTASLFTPGQDSTLASPSSTTIYTVLVTDGQGCSKDTTVTVNVNPIPTVNASDDTTICFSDSATLLATGALNYVWAPADSLSDPNSANPVATPAATSTYLVTGTDLNGCSDTADVTLTVLPPPVVTTSGDQTICATDTVTIFASGGTSVVFSGGPIAGTSGDSAFVHPTVTTVYTATVQNAAGCSVDTTITVNVNSNPTVETSNDTTICFSDTASLQATGALTYIWTPTDSLFTPNSSNTLANPTATTTYTVTGTDVNFCTDTAAVVVTVLPELVLTASADPTICEFDTATIFASGGVSTSWTGLPLLGTSGDSAFVNPTTSTTYSARVTNAIGCFKDTSITVNVIPAPVVAGNGPHTICEGDSVELIATGGTIYTWSGPNVSSPSNDSTFVSPSSTTGYIVDVSNGTCSDTTLVTVNVNPRPAVVTSNDTTICYQDTASLIASGALNYSWSPADSLSSTTIANPIAFPANTTVYQVIGEDANLCRDTGTVTVTVLAPIAITTPGDVTICQFDTATIEASGGTSTLFTGSSILSQAVDSALVNPTGTTIYTATVSDAAGCSRDTTITVNVIPAPVITQNGPHTICEGDSVQLIATGGTIYTWSGPNVSSPSNDSTFVSPSSTTGYIVDVSNGTCSDTTLVTVNVNPRPTLATSSDTTICYLDTANLSVTGALTYSWSPADSLSNTSIANPIAFPVNTTTYTVIGEDANLCRDTGSVTVTVLAPIAITTPGDVTICEFDTATIEAGGGISTLFSGGPLISQASDTALANPTTTTVYTATVTDAGGCSRDTTITVNVIPAPVITQNGPHTICEGDSVQLIATGGISYTWTGANISSPSNDSTFVNPTTTTGYIVDVSNGACSDTTLVTVNVNPLPTVGISDNDTLCLFESTLLVATGGINYNWSPADSLSDAGNDSTLAFPGSTTSFLVTVEDANGCIDTASTTVVVNPLPTITTSANDSLCLGDTTTLCGFGAPSFVWNQGATLDDSTLACPLATPTGTTQYTVTGTDANGCSDTASVFVFVSIPGTAVVSNDTTICNGDSLQLSASGGVIYSWDPNFNIIGANTATPTVFPSVDTTYTVFIEDAVGCRDTASTSVTVLPFITISTLPSVSDTICFGDTLAISAGGASDFTWTPATTVSDPASSSPNLFPTTTTTYRIEGSTPAGCSDTTTFTLVVRDPISTTAVADDNVICLGDSTTLRATPGFTNYFWTPTDSLASSGDSVTLAFPTATTTYQLLALDSSGCGATDTLTLTVNNLPDLDVSPALDTICRLETVTLTATSATATSFSWSPDSTLNTNVGASVQASPLTDQVYLVTATDAAGCTSVDSATVLIEPVITITPIPGDTLCEGDTLTLNASVVNGVSYRWEPEIPGNILTPDSLNTRAIPTASTTYVLTVTNIANCTNSDSISVVVETFPSPIITATEDSICVGDTTMLIASGGLTYSWSPADSLSSTIGDTVMAWPVNSTTYTVTAATQNGCSTDTTFDLFVDPIPVASIAGSDTVCALDTATLIASGGVGYTWSGAGLLQTTGDTVIALPPSDTSYQLIAFNSVGCTDTTTKIIQTNALPSLIVTASPDTVCLGDTSFLNASGAASYRWEAAPTLSDTTIENPTAVPLTNTTYFVEGTDAFGCQNSDSIGVVVNSLPTASASGDASICEGDTALMVASGGIAYLWIPDSTVSAPVNDSTYARPDTTTTYDVQVTDVNGCRDTAQVTITVSPLPTGTFTAIEDTLCFGTSTTLTATLDSLFDPHPDGSYSFDGGLSFSDTSNFDFTGDRAGDTTFTVIVRDQLSCNVSDPILLTLHVLEDITYTIDTLQFPECVGPPGEFEISNILGGIGEPYLLTFEGAASTVNATDTTNFNNLLPGIYDLSVSDGKGCITEQTLNFNSAITVDSSVTDILCNGLATGEIALSNFQGGVAPYNFSISDTVSFQGDSTYSNLLAGNYTVYIRDNTGCTVPYEFELTEPTAFLLTQVDREDITCPGFNTGSITFEANGGVSPYVFELDTDVEFGTPGIQITYDSLTPGAHTVLGVDGNGCSSDLPFTIIDAADFATYITEDQAPADCFANDGSAVLDSTTGGSGNFEYAVDFVTFQDSTTFVTNELQGLGIGIYFVTTRDIDLGCLDTTSFSISLGLDVDTIDIETFTPTCVGGDGRINIRNTAFLGAPEPFDYEVRNLVNDGVISPFQTDTSFGDLSEGIYFAVIRDNIGCEYDFPFILDSNVPISISNVVITPETCEQGNGTIEIVVSGGVEPYTFSISGPVVEDSSDPLFDGLEAATYLVTAKEAVHPEVCQFTRSATITSNSVDLHLSIDSVSCIGLEDGVVTIDSISNVDSSIVYTFSVNDTTNFTADSVFSGLDAGLHEIYIQELNPVDSSTCHYVDVNRYFDITIDSVFSDSLDVTSFYVFEPDSIRMESITEKTDKGRETGTVELLEITGGTSGYFWSITDSIESNMLAYDTAQDAENKIFEVGEGFHDLYIVDANQCMRKFEVFVDINFFLPNIITPNNDGVNDTFIIYSLLPGTRLTVYDKWGSLVYQTNDYQNEWDGGRQLDGVYFYELSHPDRTEKGWIQIVR